MHPMKRRAVRWPTLNLVARSLEYSVTNPASDYHAGPSNENVGVGKSVLHYGARCCGVSDFTASSGVLDPLQRQFVPWSRAENRSGSIGITYANPGAQRFYRKRDTFNCFCLKDTDLPIARRVREDDFFEKVCGSGTLTNNLLTADLRGEFKPSVVGLAFRGTGKGRDTTIRGENHHVDEEKVAGLGFKGTGRGLHTAINGYHIDGKEVAGLGFRGTGRGLHTAINGYHIDGKVFVGSGFRLTVRVLRNESEGKNHHVDEREVAGLGLRATVRGLHTEIKGENHRMDEKMSEKVATVRKVRSAVRTKASSITSRTRRMVERLVPTTTIPQKGPVNMEVLNSVSISQREMELVSRTEREVTARTTGGHATAQLVDQDHQEETQKGFGQIVRTISPPESRNVFQHVTVTEDDEMSRRAAAEAMALLRAALDEADDDTEDGKVEEELQRSLKVGIVGAPNAGKSLLTNQLVGTRVSAVSRKTNTTHREHLGVYTKGDTQLLYYDTPGLHLDIEGSPLRVDAQHRVRNAWEIVDFCEALVVLVDAERQIRRPDKRVQRLVEKLGKPDENVSQKRVLCLNKVDIIEQKRTLLPLAKQFEDLLGYDRIFMISGLTGSGVKDVKDYLVSQAVLRPWDEDPELKDHRDIALEVVREQVFEHLHEELPHTTKQKLVSWKVLKDGSIRIQQLLLVAKKEHQKILVGKNGAVIGDIGIKARKELTQVLGATVHLVLDVKLMSSSMTADH